MSETTVIESVDSLDQVFRQRVNGGDLGWAGRGQATVLTGSGADKLHIEFDGRTVDFVLAFRLNPGRRDVEVLARDRTASPVLLVTVRLSQALVRHCRELGLSCADLNGKVWIRAKGILIDTTHAPPRGGGEYTIGRTDPDLFSPKSSRLARALLSLPDRAWRQADLVATTGLATGLVSRLLNHLVHVGWAAGDRGDWRLTAPDALLDAWRAADDWTKRVTIREYATLERDTQSVARRLADQPGHPLAFTLWFAAALRHPYADVPVVSAYRDAFPEEEELRSLSLTPVPTGGRVWILVPRDRGVFQVGRLVEGFPLVCDVQIYLDLLNVGLRGPDQAGALRQWPGFRR